MNEQVKKIKAEIDKRYAEYREKMKTDDFTYYEGMADALDLFEQFIDSLPAETSGELVKEVQRYYFDNFDYITSDQPTLSILTNIARHFAKWQKEQMMKEADLRPSWKPSEEQMKALLNIEGDLRAFQSNDKAKIIAELYEQLKRLL